MDPPQKIPINSHAPFDPNSGLQVSNHGVYRSGGNPLPYGHNVQPTDFSLHGQQANTHPRPGLNQDTETGQSSHWTPPVAGSQPSDPHGIMSSFMDHFGDLDDYSIWNAPLLDSHPHADHAAGYNDLSVEDYLGAGPVPSLSMNHPGQHTYPYTGGVGPSTAPTNQYYDFPLSNSMGIPLDYGSNDHTQPISDQPSRPSFVSPHASMPPRRLESVNSRHLNASSDPHTRRLVPTCVRHTFTMNLPLIAVTTLQTAQYLLEDRQRPGQYASNLAFVRQYPQPILFFWGARKKPMMETIKELPPREHFIYTVHPVYVKNLHEMGSLVAVVQSVETILYTLETRSENATPNAREFQLGPHKYKLKYSFRSTAQDLSFDFGSAWTFIPQEAYDFFKKHLQLVYCQLHPTMPVLRFNTKDGHVLELSAFEYVLYDDTGRCEVLIRPNANGVWKLGATLARRYSILINNGVFRSYLADRVSYLSVTLEHGKSEPIPDEFLI
uniref:AlNc14C233G9330 protein n=1 Tax=Albugo laibachii Nc14 TaxID=890382 RepID=F0WSI7_9STRA|nr:AlNc14C233G9330 [Albugo laibachii Nc14]|eukprot:CCA24311.1 AlNc14C233G9330 [Albugo laibachii Nc14]